MPRPERLYLLDIVQAAEAIARFLAGTSQDRFASDDLLRSAVLYKLTVIGEAAARLPADLQARHPHVPWADIVGFRNIVVHAYFAVDWSIVWHTATRDVPALRDAVLAILHTDFPRRRRQHFCVTRAPEDLLDSPWSFTPQCRYCTFEPVPTDRETSHDDGNNG